MAATDQPYLQILTKLSADLISKTSFDEVLWSITENCISDLGFEDCVVYMVDNKREFLVQKAAYGPKKFENFKIVQPLKIPMGSGIVGTVAESGQAEMIADCSQDPRYIADDANRLSEIAVPIIDAGNVIGVIDSENSQANFYNDDHLSVLHAIAQLAAIRISQIKRTKSLSSHRDALAQQVATKGSELHDALNRLEALNTELAQQIDEKEELIREVHHGVKNQMQMMYSLINLQAEESDLKPVKYHLKTCMSRVRCMGLAHQMANGMTVDMSLYLRHLNDELNVTHQCQPPTKLTVEGNRSEIDMDKAVLLGFILTDLFISGLPDLNNVHEPSSSIVLNITEQCDIHYDSNWWGFEKLGGMTDLFIAQIGAHKAESESGLRMTCVQGH